MILIDCTVYQGTYCTYILDLFSHEFQTIFQPYIIMNNEITSLTYSHTERLHIFSSILIIVHTNINSRNASKFILFSM